MLVELPFACAKRCWTWVANISRSTELHWIFEYKHIIIIIVTVRDCNNELNNHFIQSMNLTNLTFTFRAHHLEECAITSSLSEVFRAQPRSISSPHILLRWVFLILQKLMCLVSDTNYYNDNCIWVLIINQQDPKTNWWHMIIVFWFGLLIGRTQERISRLPPLWKLIWTILQFKAVDCFSFHYAKREIVPVRSCCWKIWLSEWLTVCQKINKFKSVISPCPRHSLCTYIYQLRT